MEDYSLLPAGAGKFDGSAGVAGVAALASGSPAALSSMLGFNPAALLAAPLMGALGSSTTSGANTTQVVDNSNWNVNFGSGGITSTAEKTQSAADNSKWVSAAVALVALALLARAWRKG